MGKVTVNTTNFTAGEISPRMKGRVDIARYQNGADTIENGRPVVHGGIMRREGTRYLATAKLAGASRVRLIRYVFSTELAFALEFGVGYIRFFDAATGAVILDAALAILEVASPYTEAQLFEVTTKQDADAMFLFHKDVPTYRLRRISPTQWVMQPVPWITEPFAELGHYPAGALTLSLATVGAGRTFTTAATTAPAAPTIGTATPLNAAASVAFTPGAGGGLGGITFTATSTPGGLTGTATGSPVRVAGLTNAVAYTFAVTATNGIGTSAASAASNSVTPLGSLSGGTITATSTPASFDAELDHGAQSGIEGPIAAGVGGTPPYTFAWSKISGGVGIRIESGNTARATLFSREFGATNYATLRCTVTDAVGAPGTVDVPCAVTHLGARGRDSRMYE